MILWDGFSTYLSVNIFNINGLFRIQKIKPPGADGGGPIPITHMLNTRYRIQAPKYLISIEDANLVVEYDPLLYTWIPTFINFNTAITVTFPDKSSYQYYGWINKFDPQENTEGNLPLANMQICASLINPNASSPAFGESAPVYQST